MRHALMKKLLLSSLIAFAPSVGFAQTLFVDNAKQMGTNRTVDVIIEDGAITRQAATLRAPNGAERIEGAWVTQGLFSTMSSLGLTDIGSSGAGNDVASEHSHTNVSERVADSFNPRSIHIANTRRRGITHAVVAPRSGEGSIFAGTGSIVSLTGEFDSILIPEAFIMIDLGETGTQRAGGSRAASMAEFRAGINDVKGFFRRYQHDSHGGDTLSRQDAQAFTKAVNGDIPMMIRVSRASDMMRLIEIKEDNPDLDMIFVGAEEAWEIADVLAAANMRVIIDPLHNLPSAFESAGARLDNVMFLESAGVDYAFANLSSLGVAKPAILNQHAGNAVGEGLSAERALQAVTSTPAKWFNIESDTSVVWDGDPLEVTSAPIAMSIDGDAQSLESRQTLLRDRYNPISEDERPHKYR